MKIFWKVLFAISALLIMSCAFAEDAAPAAQAVATGISDKTLVQMAYMLALGIAALGGAMGQGRLVAAALEAIARNPSAAGKVQMIMILGIAFVESLVIFALISKFI